MTAGIEIPPATAVRLLARWERRGELTTERYAMLARAVFGPDSDMADALIELWAHAERHTAAA